MRARLAILGTRCLMMALLLECAGLGAGLGGGVLPSPVAQAAFDPTAHVVRLSVSKREIDPTSPWQFEGVKQQSLLAVVLPEGRLLTTAFAVADASLIEMQRFGSSRKDEVDVVFVDYEVNLALLAIRSEGATQGLRPVELGVDIGLNDDVELYKPRDSYQLTRLPGSLQEVGVFGAVTSSYSLIAYLIKVQQAGLGWAEPVFREGKLVGLTTGQDDAFVHAIPISVIRHFLEDDLGEGYRGFPAIGARLSSLVSPDLRALLKADKVEGGVRIARVMNDSPFLGKLQADDVLLEVDGVKVSEHGYYAHPKWGRVHLKHLLNQRYAGENLVLKVLRAGEEQRIEAVLRRFDSNRAKIVAYRYGQPEPHLIFAGLVFQELSRSYLRQWGKDWRRVAPLAFLYALEHDDDPPAAAGERIIFLNRVLADDINRGYGDFRRQVVESINDRPVRTMADLKAALDQPLNVRGQRYARIRLAPEGSEIILSYDGLAAAHRRIAGTYAVHTPESFYTPAINTPR